jgi:uncharacterized repeat protein (TIGR03803 family)
MIQAKQLVMAAAAVLATSASLFGQTETVLYRFQGQAANDGYAPDTELVLDKAGNLYGITEAGGGGPCVTYLNNWPGCGTIYQLTPSSSDPNGPWTYNVIWRFQGGTDGSYPSGLLAVGGRLWGVVNSGGSGNCSGGCGYLFALMPPATPGGSWTKIDVFDFPTPACVITASDAAGNLYGTVWGNHFPDGNGSPGNGSVCILTRPVTPGGSWSLTDLYDFKGVAHGQPIGDGAWPYFGVRFDRQGNLWGATEGGGHSDGCCGTLFRLAPPTTPGGEWTESVVNRASGCCFVSAVTVGKGGALFGNGTNEDYRFFDGKTQGIVFPFSGGLEQPTGGILLDEAGNLYGGTDIGGQFNQGTLYKLTPPTYAITYLYSFAGGSDGQYPNGPLTLGPGGVLYGTTWYGGDPSCTDLGGGGCGTVFRLAP